MPWYGYSPNNQLSQPAGSHTFDHDSEAAPVPVQCHAASTRNRHRQACSRQVACQVLGRQRSTTLPLGQERWIGPPQSYWCRRNIASLSSGRAREKACNSYRGRSGEEFHLSLRNTIFVCAAARYCRIAAQTVSIASELLPVCGRRHSTHKNSTTPVSREYSAPTTRSPSCWIRCSST